MRMSKLLMPTLREVPAEAEITSHKLMLRAGLIRKLAAGIYSYLPLGLKFYKKVENIVREEMDRAGAQELLMAALLPAEAYMASGRWEVFGPNMFKLKDRNDRDFCLGPTHEELFTQTMINEVHSYKEYPKTLYQIQTKYRDEARPRFGLMRGREFVMKDAYSFDLDEAGLDKSYKIMYDAYCRIFTRLGLDFTIVDADSGAMGGSGSQEFMVKSPVGEDGIAYCDSCGYAANYEKAECVPERKPSEEGEKPLEKIHTPNAHTIEELVAFMGAEPYNFAKTIIYKADDKYVAVMVRGDREVNEVKLKNLLGCTDDPELAEPAAVREITHAEVGFAGPVGIGIPVYADKEIELMENFIVGANETDMHYKNVRLGRDFTPELFADIRTIETGDKCPHCGGEIKTAQGIEVGHIFKLGTKYSDALGLKYLDENGKSQTVIMGCYGIGVSRCLAAVIEQCNDENGIIFPVSVAPYEAVVIPVNNKQEEQMHLAEEIYDRLKAEGIDALFDDRAERAGVKFKDADLIGVPVRIVVGKKCGEGIVEYKERAGESAVEKTVNDAVADVVKFIKENR
ncbi:MAG TPA: proline--tRNA ligase [Candidatus Ornithomonoglobus intestinigallinarum]|uniref:Proline--tRNA ligase n=1 Tax=Candidatus Ornithomonoglobus intestinigallinarum TaxID=2840894 RepID=A0A9D1KRI3_9FIRM|nr:proline--tRNA ligase [Candidatus Ornithomonoglobus intestinigallinarum]